MSSFFPAGFLLGRFRRPIRFRLGDDPGSPEIDPDRSWDRSQLRFLVSDTPFFSHFLPFFSLFLPSRTTGFLLRSY
jgi:hypothetical protein